MATLQARLAALITELGNDYKSIQTALGLKAPLASPALTGHPTGVTEPLGDDSTRLATTAFVKAAGIVIVNHGADGGVARPTATIVYWVGTATPTNAIATDFWLNA